MNEPLYEVGDWKSERAEASRTALRCSFSFRIRSGSKPKPMKRTERTNSLSCTKVEQLRELGFTDARSGSKGPISVRDSCALVISRSWGCRTDRAVSFLVRRQRFCSNTSTTPGPYFKPDHTEYTRSLHRGTYQNLGQVGSPRLSR